MGETDGRLQTTPCSLCSSSPPAPPPHLSLGFSLDLATPSALRRHVLTSTTGVRAATGTRPSAPATPPAPAPMALLTALLHRQNASSCGPGPPPGRTPPPSAWLTDMLVSLPSNQRLRTLQWRVWASQRTATSDSVTPLQRARSCGRT